MLITVGILAIVSASGAAVSPVVRLVAFAVMAWAFFPGLLLLMIGSAFDKRIGWPHRQNGWYR